MHSVRISGCAQGGGKSILHSVQAQRVIRVLLIMERSEPGPALERQVVGREQIESRSQSP